MTNLLNNQTLNNLDELNKKVDEISKKIYKNLKIDELPSKINRITDSLKKLNNELSSMNAVKFDNLINFISALSSTLGTVLIDNLFGDINKKDFNFNDKFTNIKNNLLVFAKDFGGKITTLVGTEFGKVKTFISSIDIFTGGIIAIIAAVVGALIYAYNTNEEFRNKVILAWENIMNLLKSVYDNVIKPIFDSIAVLCKTLWETGLNPLWDEWSELVRYIVEGVLLLWNTLLPLVTALLDWFGPILSNVLGSFGAIVGIVISGVINQFTVLLDGIKNILYGVINFIAGAFNKDLSQTWDGVVNIFVGAFELMYGTVSAIWKTILSLFSNGGSIFEGMAESVGKAFKNIVNFVIEGINKAVQVPINYLNNILNGIRKFNIPMIGPVFMYLWGHNPIKINPIPYLYNGGFVNPGQLFIANEPGNPELIGNIGGKSAVVNNTMILEGIQRAMRNAIIDGLKASGQGDVFVDVYVDGVFNERKLAQLNKKHYMKTGKPVYAR